MQRWAVRRAVHVEHGERAYLDPHGVDHQGIAFVMGDGISVPGWRHEHRMRPHTDVADFVAFGIEDRDLVRLLEHLHANTYKNKRHASRPTLGTRVRSVRAAQLDFAVLFTDL